MISLYLNLVFMRTADWIIRSFHKLGLKNIFGVTGGAVVHLFDAASQLEDLTTTFLIMSNLPLSQ